MIAGSPDDPKGYGMNDDGEPRGCAGKPMFTVLQHSGIGEIAVVVSRWFGGIKLGTGGMARAYSSSVQHGLAALAVTEKIHYTPVTLALPYDLLQTVNHTIDRLNGRIANQAYRELVLVDVDVPCRREEEFKKELEEKGQGRISYRRR